MYNLSISVQEYPSVWRVQVTFSATHSNGRADALGSNEHWIVVDHPSGDALVDALEVAKRAATIELRPNR